MVKKVIAVVGKEVYMLAILLVEMMWYKEDRTPNGAVLRRSYYHPVKIEEEVDLLQTVLLSTTRNYGFFEWRYF